jgi:Na+/proline symporter
LYSKRANSFGALVSIISGISVWQYWEHIVVSDIPGTFMGFVASAVGMIIGTFIGRFIQKEEREEKVML